MEIFGLAVTIWEVLGVVGFVFSLGGAYWKLNDKLSFLIKRNEKADEDHKLLKAEIHSMEMRVENKLVGVNEALSARMREGEARIAQQEINFARTDERLTHMQNTLSQVHEIVRQLK
jgi:phage protein U